MGARVRTTYMSFLAAFEASLCFGGGSPVGSPIGGGCNELLTFNGGSRRSHAISATFEVKYVLYAVRKKLYTSRSDSVLHSDSI
jgi:hypothetical protein